MQRKYFKNFINTLLIISFLVMPFYGIPKKAEAQSLGAYVTGLGPAITQLPLCKGKLGGATKSLFTGEFSAAWNTINEKLGNKVKEKAKKELGDTTSSLLSDSDSIKVSIEGTASDKAIKETNERAKIIEKRVTDTDLNDTCLKNIGRLVIKMLLQKMTMSTVNWINTGFEGKPSFIQNSSKFFGDIAKNEFLQFGGEINNEALFPFGKAWIRNQATHFNNKFADNARYSLDELIRNTTPQYSAQGFWLNFDQGGWGAWSAMTQYPQNNSLGFQLMASNELQRRLAGTTQSTAQNVREALQAADGFLGDQRCVDPSGVTREEHNKALAGTGKGPEPKQNDAIYDTLNTNEDGSIVYDYAQYQEDWANWNKTSDARVCNRWEYVTPGKLIAEAATSVIHYPENNLLKADDLNDAMAAIMDALLARFSNDLMQKGFANLDSEGNDGTFAYAQDSFSGDNLNQTERDFRPIQLASSWLSANPDFNIRTDLTQALIDEQRTYIEKLETQNKELNSTTDGKDYTLNAQTLGTTWTLCAQESGTCSFSGEKQVRYGTNGAYVYKTATNSIQCDNSTFIYDPAIGTPKTCDYSSQDVTTIGSNAQGLIPIINQLDYCIPGPHPGWEQDSRRVLNAVTNLIIPETERTITDDTAAQIAGAIGAIAPMAGATIGATIGTGVVPVIGTVVGAAVGVLVGAIANWVGGTDKGKIVRQYYDGIIKTFTGIQNNYKDEKDPNAHNMSSKQGVVQALNTILERYIDLVHLVYNEKVLPSMYRDAYAEFNKLHGYEQIIENNKDRISAMKGVITTLEQIKENVDALNRQYPDKDGDYENQLQAQIDAFGRLSADMVNGDDIAGADNLLKQIIDEEDYVYNDLLKGPFGCEKELQDSNHLSDKLNQTKRMEYPFPILYTYDIDAGGNIPDPLDSGFINKTNVKANNTLGPGFLSYLSFQHLETSNPVCVANENGEVPSTDSAPCKLIINDLLPMLGDKKPADRRRLGSAPNDEASGPFEHTIGVY